MGSFDFCRSCGSGNVKVIIKESEKFKTWECQECKTRWNEYKQSQDDSEFVTGDLKDGSEIMYDKD